jgi:hypothetical protein
MGMESEFIKRVSLGHAARTLEISTRREKPPVKHSYALTAQLDNDKFSTLLVIQSFRPDWLFDTQQQQRLSELMSLEANCTRSRQNSASRSTSGVRLPG